MASSLRMLPWIGALALGLVLGPAATRGEAGQGELVIHKKGTKVYHRPSCPVVSDTTDVLALTRAQAEGRGYKPHEDCDPANPDAPAAAGKVKPETVYLDGSRYYHRKTCTLLQGKGVYQDGKAEGAKSASGVKSASLEEAGKSHWPCPTCKPTIRKRSTSPAGRGAGRGGG